MPLNHASPLAALLRAPMRPGVIRWIGVRPARRAPVTEVSAALLDPIEGLRGDHYGNRASRARQVTLVSREHLAAIAAYLGLAEIAPERLRRNVVTEGINLLALKGRPFRLGTALLEMTGECHPCSRMEQTFGSGGYNAVRGHGGITARILTAGEIGLGDPLVPVDDDPPP